MLKSRMKKLAFLVLLHTVLTSQAQNVNDAQLTNRLQEYISLTKKLDFEKAMDYTHPKLFTIAPRKMVVQAMNQAFTSKEMKIRFDSMSIASISPVYKFNNASYRKIDYYMALTVSLSDSTDLKNAELAEFMQLSFEAGFPGKKVIVDTVNNAIKVAGNEIMFAIKDPTVKEWMFLGYDKSKPEMITKLYPKQVRQYFKIL